MHRNVRRLPSLIGVVFTLAALAALPSLVEAQEVPQISTPVGTFEVRSVVLADDFPVGCRSNSGFSAVPRSCNYPARGKRLLVIEFFNEDASTDSHFTDPIQADIKNIEVVDEAGAKWLMGMRQWGLGQGITMVFTGPGSPERVILTWPGNEPLTLITGEGT